MMWKGLNSAGPAVVEAVSLIIIGVLYKFMNAISITVVFNSNELQVFLNV